ncbi:hypothetical protein AB205_0199540, partial [Aquarana catesbeiana]
GSNLEKESLFRELIWKKGQSRISLQTLQLPIKDGAQLQHLAGCGTLGGGNSNNRMMIKGAPNNTLVEALEADSFTYRCPTIKLVSKVWQVTKALMGYNEVTEYTPLWHNKNLAEIRGIERPWEWERQGISRLIQLYEDNLMKSFLDLRQEFNTSNKAFYKYLQIRHASQAQFRSQIIEWTQIPVLLKIINSASTKGLISKMYTSLGERIISG